MQRLEDLPQITLYGPDGSVRVTGIGLAFANYAENGNVAIEAYCTEDSKAESGMELFPGEPWGTLTVNVGPLPDDRIAVKDYSEGSGNVLSLQKAGLIGDEPEEVRSSGFVLIPVYTLTEKGIGMRDAAAKAREAEEAE